MKYALIGKTLAHSYSKIIHEAMGEYEYDLVPLLEDEVRDFALNCPYGGFNVTIPYKQTIMPFCDYISPQALKIGSVNTVLKKDGKLYGYNTDYDGFEALSKRGGIDFKNKKVAILGSGGTYLTAKAVATDCGAKEIISVSRNGEFNYGNINAWNDCDIIINTTPVGMYPKNGESIISLDDFPKCRGVIDVIYNPYKTRLIFEAEQRGIPAIGGLYMLVYQAKRAFEIFLGKELSLEKTEEIFKKLRRDMTNIIIVGMPGSGKSTLGKLIAKETGREFIDTDEEIVKEAKMTISEIFEKYGEGHFRSLESEIALKCGSLSGKVIATGGGIVTVPQNLYSLKQNSTIYYIKRDTDKLSMKGRPLSTDRERLYKMEKERAPLYERFSDKIIDNNCDKSEFKFEY